MFQTIICIMWMRNLLVSLSISYSNQCLNWALNQSHCDSLYIICLKICFQSLKLWQECITNRQGLDFYMTVCEFSSFFLGCSRTSVHGYPTINSKSMAPKYAFLNCFSFLSDYSFLHILTPVIFFFLFSG